MIFIQTNFQHYKDNYSIVVNASDASPSYTREAIAY